MASSATLSILQTLDQFIFHLEAPLDSAPLPGQPLNAPTSLMGSTRLDPDLHIQLAQATEAAAELVHILHPGSPDSIHLPDAGATKPLERLGRLLFSLLPLTLQQALSALPDRLPLVLVTNDTALPWELLHDGAGYLALLRPVSRQLLDVGPARRNARPGQLRRAFLFISNPEGNLPEADAEAQALMDAFDAAPERIDTEFLAHKQATRFAVREALASGQYVVIHYSGHALPGALKLADGELTAEEIQKTLRGQPFIFLNACHSARDKAPPALTAVGLPYAGLTVRSLASAFLLGGAAGFIGTLWRVFDSHSRQFAERFYALAREGVPVGEALQRTRSHLFPDPLWAAFVMYGDPTLRIAGLERRETRPATALVARLFGHRQLFEALGLETAADVESQIAALLSQAAERYGGHVHSLLADRFTVSFGLPRVHENDAERAIRAALDMTHRLRAFAEKQLAARPTRLGLHMGISSGTVVGRQLHTPTGVAYQMIGPVIAFAASLADQAPAGQVLLDEETCRRAETVFTFEVVEPLAVSEGEPPINAYRIREIKPTPAPTTKLIGRGGELAQVQGWWREALGKQGRVVGIVGATGVGKSHFVRAFKEILADQTHHWIAGVCQSYDEAIPYSLLAQVVMGLAERLPEDGAATQRHQLEKLVRATIHGAGAKAEEQFQEGLALLGEVIGVRFSAPGVETLDPKLRQRKLAGVLQAVLAGRAEQSPLVILLEDLHWVDEASLAVLHHIVGAMGQMRVLLLAVYRSDWSPDWTRRGHDRHLSLEELDPEAQRALLASLLGVETPPAPVADVILSRAGGNPFFIEAIVRALREKGGLSRSGDTWQLAVDLNTALIPDQIETALQARLDQLTPSTLAVLQIASVIGQAFEYQILTEVVDVADRADLDPCLNELMQSDLILEAGGWWPNVNYAFRHSLIQQVTYARLPEAFRRILHRRLAQELLRAHGDDVGSVLEQLAHHYDHSDDRVSAVRYGLLAARRAADVWANQTALDWYGRALAKLGSFDETLPSEAERERGATSIQILEWTLEALSGRGEVLVTAGRHDEAIVGYARALTLAESVEAIPNTRRADLYYRLAIAYLNRGAFEAAQEALNTGLRVLNGRACLEAGRLHVWTGMIHFRTGQLAEGLAACEQGIALIEQTETQLDLAQAYNLQGIIHRNMGHPSEALRAHENSIALYQQADYLPGLEKAYSNLACVYQDLGRWNETLQYFQKSAELSDRTGEERRRAAAHINLSEIYYLKGDLERAIEACEKARALAETFGLSDYLGLVALNLGKVYLKQGQLAQARRYLEESLDICRRLRNEMHLPEILRHMAMLSAKEGWGDEALRFSQEAITLAMKMGPRETGQAHRTLGIVYRGREEWDEAEARLKESLSITEAQSNRHEAGLTLLELAWLCQARIRRSEGDKALRAQGREYCDHAIAIFSELGADYELRLAREIRRSLEG